MSMDRETVAVYDARAQDYADCLGRSSDPMPSLTVFIDGLPKGGRVLDLGCGPGSWARLMAEAGLEVEAIDASEAMVAETAKLPGVTVWQSSFEEISAEARYDGIWANFSLLHAPRSEITGHLARLHRALKPGGRLHIGLKEGTGSARDGLGRFYTYYTVAEMRGLLEALEMTVGDLREGADEGLDGVVAPWFTLTATKGD